MDQPRGEDGSPRSGARVSAAVRASRLFTEEVNGSALLRLTEADVLEALTLRQWSAAVTAQVNNIPMNPVGMPHAASKVLDT